MSTVSTLQAYANIRSLLLYMAGAVLITAGFASDMVLFELGHHAGFILGGVAIGYGFRANQDK